MHRPLKSFEQLCTNGRITTFEMSDIRVRDQYDIPLPLVEFIFRTDLSPNFLPFSGRVSNSNGDRYEAITIF